MLLGLGFDDSNKEEKFDQHVLFTKFLKFVFFIRGNLFTIWFRFLLNTDVKLH